MLVMKTLSEKSSLNWFFFKDRRGLGVVVVKDNPPVFRGKKLIPGNESDDGEIWFCTLVSFYHQT